jgi:hypothetical protein
MLGVPDDNASVASGMSDRVSAYRAAKASKSLSMAQRPHPSASAAMGGGGGTSSDPPTGLLTSMSLHRNRMAAMVSDTAFGDVQMSVGAPSQWDAGSVVSVARGKHNVPQLRVSLDKHCQVMATDHPTLPPGAVLLEAAGVPIRSHRHLAVLLTAHPKKQCAIKFAPKAGAKAADTATVEWTAAGCPSYQPTKNDLWDVCSGAVKVAATADGETQRSAPPTADSPSQTEQAGVTSAFRESRAKEETHALQAQTAELRAAWATQRNEIERLRAELSDVAAQRDEVTVALKAETTRADKLVAVNAANDQLVASLRAEIGELHTALDDALRKAPAYDSATQYPPLPTDEGVGRMRAAALAVVAANAMSAGFSSPGAPADDGAARSASVDTEADGPVRRFVDAAVQAGSIDHQTCEVRALVSASRGPRFVAEALRIPAGFVGKGLIDSFDPVPAAAEAAACPRGDVSAASTSLDVTTAPPPATEKADRLLGMLLFSRRAIGPAELAPFADSLDAASLCALWRGHCTARVDAFVARYYLAAATTHASCVEAATLFDLFVCRGRTIPEPDQRRALVAIRRWVCHGAPALVQS